MTIPLLLITSTGGAQRPPQAPSQLVVQEVWRTTGNDLAGGPIGAVSGLAALADGTILVSDPVQRRVVALTEQGRAKAIVARPGQGPGEVQNPSRISQRGDQYAVYDIGGGRIDVFSARDGRFVRRVQLTALVTWVKGFVMLPNGGFVLSGGLPGSRHSIHHFGANGQRLTAWGDIPVTQNWMAATAVAGGPLLVQNDGSLLYSRAAPHEIIRYAPGAGGHFDQQGATFAKDPTLLDPVGDDALIVSRGADGRRVQSFADYARSTGLLPLSNGLLLNVVTFGEDGTTTLQLYNAQGRIVGSHRIGRAYQAWDVTSSDHLLVTYIDPDTEEWVVAALRLF